MAPTRPLRAAAVASTAVAALAVVGVGGTAHAECPVMTFAFDTSSGKAVLDPSRLTVSAGGCVTLQNSTITSANFTVGSSFRRTVPAFSTTQYAATAAGSTQPVTASGAAGSAHGSIVIRPRPAPSKSASPTATHTASPRPSARRSSPASRSPRPHPQSSSAQSSAQSSVATPPAPRATPPPPPVNSLPPVSALTPSVAPSTSSSPTPSSSASPSVAVVSGPLQPPTDRGTGLPAAVAALAVVATAAALLRVLLAEPVRLGAVDSGDSVGATV